MIMEILHERSLSLGSFLLDLEHPLAMIFEYDLWIMGKLSEMEIEDLLMLISTRARKEFEGLIQHLVCLLYASTACISVLSGRVERYNTDTLKLLVEWSKSYGREVDAYIDTVNTLITDEYFEAIRDYLSE